MLASVDYIYLYSVYTIPIGHGALARRRRRQAVVEPPRRGSGRSRHERHAFGANDCHGVPVVLAGRDQQGGRVRTDGVDRGYLLCRACHHAQAWAVDFRR